MEVKMSASQIHTLTDSMNLFFCFSLVAFTLKKVDSNFRESYSVTSLEQMPERGQ